MIVRFCLYSVLKNLRFADPFLAIYFLELGFSYAEIGALLGCQRLVTAVLETPSGIAADRWGRRSVLALSFALHAFGLLLLAMGADRGASHDPFWFHAGLSVYGAGEAMRTGSHKAMVLDYLDSNGLADRATSVLAVTRTFSKSSSAVAGSIAGGILYLTQDYAVLFWASAAAAVAGGLLILSYPKYLEGERSRGRQDVDRTPGQVSERSGLFRNARAWMLMLQSAVYESQVEVVLKLLLQPLLYMGLTSAGLPLPTASETASRRGVGALFVGANELFRDGLGAVGARGSVKFERAAGGRGRTLRLVYLLTIACVVAVGLCTLDVSTWFLPGLVTIGLITMLQNIRRPLFVGALNDASNKSQRATVLSIDNQATSVLVAVQMPLVGMAADAWGLPAVCSAAFLLLGAFVPTLRAKNVSRV